MKLVIVESPSKAKTIGKYLGKEFQVKASVGHVRDLPKSSKKAVDIEHGFVPHYEIVAGKEKIIDEIRSGKKGHGGPLGNGPRPRRRGHCLAHSPNYRK